MKFDRTISVLGSASVAQSAWGESTCKLEGLGHDWATWTDYHGAVAPFSRKANHLCILCKPYAGGSHQCPEKENIQVLEERLWVSNQWNPNQNKNHQIYVLPTRDCDIEPGYTNPMLICFNCFASQFFQEIVQRSVTIIQARGNGREEKTSGEAVPGMAWTVLVSAYRLFHTYVMCIHIYPNISQLSWQILRLASDLWVFAIYKPRHVESLHTDGPWWEMTVCQLSTIKGFLARPLPSSPCRKYGQQPFRSCPLPKIAWPGLVTWYVCQNARNMLCHSSVWETWYPPNNIWGLCSTKYFTQLPSFKMGHHTWKRLSSLFRRICTTHASILIGSKTPLVRCRIRCRSRHALSRLLATRDNLNKRSRAP